MSASGRKRTPRSTGIVAHVVVSVFDQDWKLSPTGGFLQDLGRPARIDHQYTQQSSLALLANGSSYRGIVRNSLRGHARCSARCSRTASFGQEECEFLEDDSERSLCSYITCARWAEPVAHRLHHRVNNTEVLFPLSS